MYSSYEPELLIYCINLKHRTDRKLHTYTEFKKLGFSSDNVIYPHFVKDKRGGVYGCYDSHIKIWQDFLFNYPNQNYCLIFEDDFVSNTTSRQQIEEAKKMITNNDIDIIMLHHLCIPTKNTINNKYFVNGYGLLTQAYLINRQFIQRIWDNNNNSLPQPNGKHIDSVINIDFNDVIYTEKIFYTRQQCFSQLVDKSDNYINVIDKLFRRDINKTILNLDKINTFVRDNGILNDKQIKQFWIFLNNYL